MKIVIGFFAGIYLAILALVGFSIANSLAKFSDKALCVIGEKVLIAPED